MKSIMFVASVLLSSCGAVPTGGLTGDPQLDFGDYVGERANEARQHMSDRNISSNDVAKGYITARNDSGAEANRARNYAYDRGIDEMRNGDSDSQQKHDAAEKRLAAIESVNKAQDSLLSALKGALEIETSARRFGDSALEIDFKDAMDEFSESFTTLIDALSGRVDSTEDSIETINSASYISGLVGVVKTEVIDSLKADIAFLASIKGDKGDPGTCSVSLTSRSFLVWVNNVTQCGQSNSSCKKHNFKYLTISVPTVTCN